MNNQSGSALSRITFLLALFIAAALGFLVVREFLRPEPAAAQSAEPVESAVSEKPSARHPSVAPAAAQPAYAPLRPRANPPSAPANNVLPAVPAIRVETAQPVPPIAAVAAAPVVPAVNVPRAAVPAVQPGGGAGVGNVSMAGRVFLRGVPPPEKPITMDAACTKLNNAPLTTRHYLVGRDSGLGDVFVYVKDAPPAPPLPGTPLLDQSGCMFEPYILGVQTGQVFQVRNSDNVLHNLHIVPRKVGNRERNIGQPVKGYVTPFTFDVAENFIQIKCDVHPWMFAYVCVVEHPWFAVTDRDGNFTLPPGLPLGEYTLAAVHRRAGEQTQRISVRADGTAPVAFTFNVP